MGHGLVDSQLYGCDSNLKVQSQKCCFLDKSVENNGATFKVEWGVNKVTWPLYAGAHNRPLLKGEHYINLQIDRTLGNPI